MRAKFIGVESVSGTLFKLIPLKYLAMCRNNRPLMSALIQCVAA